jgi:hypothetical protein
MNEGPTKKDCDDYELRDEYDLSQLPGSANSAQVESRLLVQPSHNTTKNHLAAFIEAPVWQKRMVNRTSFQNRG